MDEYRRSQIGYLILVTCALVALLFVAVLSKPAYGIVFLALVVALFWRLTVTVRGERLTYAFGFGLIRRSVPLAEIADCEPIPYQWYWGYGIRLTPRGMVYIVNGVEAVQFTLHSGRRFSLGTDEPQQLCEAVKKARVLAGATGSQRVAGPG